MSESVTQGQAAKLFGKSRKTICRWISSGAPKNADGSVDPDALKAWAVDRGLFHRTSGRPVGSVNGAPAVKPDPPKPGAGLGYAGVKGRTRDKMVAAKLREAQAKAELKELELQQKRGDLLSASEVAAGRLARIAAVKGLLEALPGRLAGRLAHKSPREVRLGLETAVRETLAAFAGAEAA